MTTKDFKRMGLLGKGSYAEVYLVEKIESESKRGGSPGTGKYYAMKRMKKA